MRGPSPLNIGCFVLCSLPALWLCGLAFGGGLGVNPLETLTHATGLWSLRLLLLTLTMTPLQRLLRQPWPIRIRRQLGLWSFFYLSIHVSLFLVFDLSLDPALLLTEIIERPYITAGFAALVMLTPLAVTSTRGWQRRLKRRWKALHRLIYPAAIAACLHFLWKTKVSELEPALYAGLLAALLLVRIPRTRPV